MRIGVVGGGIAGLAAAHRLLERAPEAEVVLFEQGAVLGGKLRTTTIAGGLVERGAEAFLTSDPSAVDLAQAVGLGAALTRPTPAKAAIAVGGALRDIPSGTLMGIPLDPVAGVPDEPAATPLLAPGADVAVGALVRPRRGDDAVDTFVEPLLGGVYAGRADALSLRMAVPALAAAAESAHTLTEALAAAVAARAGGGSLGPAPAARPGGPGSAAVAGGAVAGSVGGGGGTGPAAGAGGAVAGSAAVAGGGGTGPAAVAGGGGPGSAAVAGAGGPGSVTVAAGGPGFATVVGGMSRLVEALAGRLPDVRLETAVRELHPTPTGWRLVVGATRAPSTVDCDAVVLAVPAAPAARLLSTVDGVVPVPLDYASVALVALAFEHVALPELAGFLVPPREGFGVKAATFFDRKWAHHRRADGVSVVRASLGRAGETAVLQQRDEDLVAQVRLELAKLLGVDTLPVPIDAGVYRWGGGLPQYTPGHRNHVERLRQGLAGRAPVAVAGAAYDGVGIPACVRSGRAAADAVLDSLGG